MYLKLQPGHTSKQLTSGFCANQLAYGVSPSFLGCPLPQVTLSPEVLPEHGHLLWAAGPGSPPSTLHLGLPCRSSHRAHPGFSLVGEERPEVGEEC